MLSILKPSGLKFKEFETERLILKPTSKEDAKFTPPSTKKDSSIAPLILGLYNQIDDYVNELQDVVKNSIDGKIFIYSKPSLELFNDKDYVKNLDKLANSGVLPAKVLRLIVQKLNLQAKVLERLKEVYRQISRSDEWVNYRVNLSAGGFSFLSENPYEKFGLMDIFMDIDSEILVNSYAEFCLGVNLTWFSSHFYKKNEHIEYESITSSRDTVNYCFDLRGCCGDFDTEQT